MEYNTQQRTLPLPEYGRSVQNMGGTAGFSRSAEERFIFGFPGAAERTNRSTLPDARR